MNPSVSGNRYRIRVAGHLDDHWSARLGGHQLTREHDGTTTVRTAVLDQAQLHGTLTAIRDIGAPLLAVEPADPVPAPSGRPLALPLTTDRLILRPAGPDDAACTWTYRRLPEVNEWLEGPLPDLETYTAHFTAPHRLADTLIVQLRGHSGADSVTIGDLMLRLSDAWSHRDLASRAHVAQAELGWVLDPAHTGQGYATEAVHALLDHSFTTLGVHRATAECFLDNEASWRLMERVGMRREAHARRNALHRSGRWLDSVTYAALAEEWQPHTMRRPPARLAHPEEHS